MSKRNRELSQAIKTEAFRLGFKLVGITSPDAPAHLDVYNQWLEEGSHGEMDYLATDRAKLRRADPLQILPECLSILILGIPYPAPPPYETPAGPRTQGRVASYAWGNDYHHVLARRLESLIRAIENIYGSSFPKRWYTDTGPILERELAQRAGLGWIGKNTCLINPQSGSYFLLAEIFLGIDLEPDLPMAEDYCGSCTRCIDACPTRCILPNRTIDARVCISYLTIELKTAIPTPLRSQVEDWVFGCDICQQVCPWNIRFATTESDPDLAPIPGRARPDLPLELLLDARAFSERFSGSPIKRSRRRGYLRNVVVALGNSLDPAGIDPLGMALRDDEPLVRSHAAWALGQVGGPEPAGLLKQALESETDPEVVREIREALQRIASNDDIHAE
jgi:epoxyqueuosine reductase